MATVIKDNLISLSDGTELEISSDRWEFDSEDNLILYREDKVVFCKQWKKIFTIYSSVRKEETA